MTQYTIIIDQDRFSQYTGRILLRDMLVHRIPASHSCADVVTVAASLIRQFNPMDHPQIRLIANWQRRSAQLKKKDSINSTGIDQAGIYLLSKFT
jgi:hypothetical protein